MLKCYVLDDEQHAVDALCGMLKKKFASTTSVCGSSTKASVAIEEIENCSPDILFLDVEMPEMTGLEVLRHFPHRNFEVIFTTAHERYALPALKAAAVDYLMKPLSPQDVHEALQRCALKKQSTEIEKNSARWITLQDQQGMLVVNPEDVIRVEANNNYSIFHFTNRPKLVVSKTLKDYEDLLATQGFFRVHQSHLINLAHIVSVNTNDGDYVLLTNDQRVEISRRRKPDFVARLKQSR